jgi:hypothetical protein
MVGASAMGTEPFDVRPLDDESPEQARERVLDRFERIGTQIMNRTSGGGPFAGDPIAGVLTDRDKRRMAARILGQAYVAAHALVQHNREAVERIADALVERREIFGDELLGLLEGAQLQRPELDYADEAAWPKI